MNDSKLINREEKLFDEDLLKIEKSLNSIIKNSSFLVIGGAGSIGQAVTIEIFKRNPQSLHVIDISENNLVELVRNLRSSLGYISGEFKTFAIDCASIHFEALTREYSYDYVFNLSALKHVRSEKDPYTLMRLIEVNIFNTVKTLNLLNSKKPLKNFFSVSTDKAVNPVNMMGASKKIMENFLVKESEEKNISMARFANVAFSDGSLLHGFNQRILKKQPIAAPRDVKRYFITSQESGELCLLAGLFGEKMDIFFPKLEQSLHLQKFSEIAKNYLNSLGFSIKECKSEEEARELSRKLIKKNIWPCYFFDSDTSGEKDFEEFFTSNELLDLKRFKSIGIIKNQIISNNDSLKFFKEEIDSLKQNGKWEKKDLLEIFKKTLPEFEHIETGKDLDQKM